MVYWRSSLACCHPEQTQGCRRLREPRLVLANQQKYAEAVPTKALCARSHVARHRTWPRPGGFKHAPAGRQCRGGSIWV